jgi:hypothetical protein
LFVSPFIIKTQSLDPAMALQKTTTSSAPALATDSHSDSDSAIIYTPTSTASMASSSLTTNITPDPSKSANISVRKYIYLLPYPLLPKTPVPYSIHLPAKNPLNLPPTLFEPTTTLVLTSPLNTFVDLRFFKPLVPSPDSDLQLDWGFAGTSSSVPITKKKWKGVTHTTWTHFVDSRGSSDEVDEGDMYPISQTLTLEHGHAFHPHVGAVRSHEEMWEDQLILSTSTSSTHDTKICIVLRLHDDAKNARGVVIRLGQYVQGIVVVGTEVTAERWEWSNEGGWMRTKRVGKGMLPCGVVMREEIMSVGAEIGVGEVKWDVEEVWEWE